MEGRSSPHLWIMRILLKIPNYARSRHSLPSGHDQFGFMWSSGLTRYIHFSVASKIVQIREAIVGEKWCFFEHCSNGGGGQPMFKNFVGNCRSFWRSFNNMKLAWKGTFEALMVKFGGEIGTLYQIFTPCTPLPKYKRAFTWFLGGSNSLPGCRRIFYRGLP